MFITKKKLDAIIDEKIRDASARNFDSEMSSFIRGCDWHIDFHKKKKKKKPVPVASGCFIIGESFFSRNAENFINLINRISGKKKPAKKKSKK